MNYLVSGMEDRIQVPASSAAQIHALLRRKLCYACLMIITTLAIFLISCNKHEYRSDPVILLSSSRDQDNAAGALLLVSNIEMYWDKADLLVPMLVKCLKSDFIGSRANAALALGSYGQLSKRAIDDLIIALDDEDVRVRGNAAMALGEIRLEPGKVIPALIDIINKRDKVSWLCMQSIEKYDNHDIMPYMNAIQSFIGSSRPDVSDMAKNIIAEMTINNGINSDTALFNAIMSKDTSRVEELLSSGANPEAMDCIGRTALQYSCYYGNVDVVKLLVMYGANTKLSYKNKTLLDIAVGGGDLQIIQYVQSLFSKENTPANSRSIKEGAYTSELPQSNGDQGVVEGDAEKTGPMEQK